MACVPTLRLLLGAKMMLSWYVGHCHWGRAVKEAKLKKAGTQKIDGVRKNARAWDPDGFTDFGPGNAPSCKMYPKNFVIILPVFALNH